MIFYLKIMLGVSDNHFSNLHSLMALNYRCVGDFRSQGDGPRPKIAILQNQFCHDISISKSCSGSQITILATYKA